MNKIGLWFPKPNRLLFFPQVTFQSQHSGSEEMLAPQRRKIEPVSCHGSLYFVFVEVCDKLFPHIPRATIKSRMRNLGLKLVKAPQEILDKLRTARPYLACYKVLSLISKREVAILEAYQDSREERRENSRKNSGPFLTNASVNDSNYTQGVEQSGEEVFLRDKVQDTMPPKKHGFSSSFLVENLLNAACPESLAVEKPLTGFSDSQEQMEIVDRQISSDSEPELSDFSPSDSNLESSSGEESGGEQDNDIVELFKKKNLDIDSFPGVVKRLSEMKEFFQTDFNSKRRQSKISDVTWAKTLERLVIFLAYCSRTLERDMRLELVEDMNIVESFIKHIKQSRRVKNNTAAAYVTCFIKAAKFLRANENRSNYDAVESISDLRALQNQLMREHAVLESTKGPEKRRLFWPQLQELTRSLHQQFEDEIDDLQQKARLHMNFTLLLLFAINPGRAKEFRTLRIVRDIPESEIDLLVRKLPSGENFMVFGKNGVTRLVEKGYKTVKRYGSNVIEISEFDFVDFHLKRYVERSRPKLVPRGCMHDFFFVNKRGSPFKSPGSFSSYLAKIFRENLGFHCTMNEMRHALVENFRSSKESSDVQLAESLARVCKHSLRTQIKVYDQRSQQERTKRALYYLNQSAVNAIVDDAPGTSYNADDESDDSLGEESYPPAPGEICALIPADARAATSEIFLAKVLKYSSDGQTVRLAWLQQVEGKPNHYKFQVGHSAWEEKISSLIYPLDVSYNRNEGSYELRSPKEEIYQQLRSAVSV